MNLPANERSEIAVLSAVLRNGDLIDLILAQDLSRASFTGEFRQTVFTAMQELAASGQKIDLITLSTKLPGCNLELVDLHGQISTDVNIDQWLRLIKQAQAARMMLIDGHNLLAATERSPIEATADNIDKMLAKLGEARRLLDGTRAKNTRQLAAEYLDYCRDLSQYGETGIIPYFPAGTEASMRLHHHRREMHVIAAGTGTGKTALATGFVPIQLAQGLKVLYVCTESDSAAILARIAAQHSRVSHFIVQKRQPNKVELARFGNGLKAIAEYDRQLFIRGCETGISSAAAIRSEVKQIIAEIGALDVLVIDFLQFMQVPQFMQNKDKRLQIDYNVEAVHQMLIELNIAGIIQAQLNRDGQKGNGLPGLEHLKESSKIGELAHTVSFLYRPPDKPDKPPEPAVWYSRKTRNQPPFFLKLAWDGVGYVSAEKYGDGHE